MNDPEHFLRKSLLRSMEGLRDAYLVLSSQSAAQRDIFVVQLNGELERINREIESDTVAREKLLILNFLFLTRVQCTSEGLTASGMPSDRNYRYFLEQVAGLSKQVVSSITTWRWQRPTQSEFTDLVWTRLQQNDFYTQVQFLCHQVYGARLPRPDSSFASWATDVCISEDAWSWQYVAALADEQKRWFPSSRRLRSLNEAWEVHRTESKRCIQSLASLFSSLSTIGEHLESLRTRQLSTSIRCMNANRAHEAIRNGVQLKHLLLEEGVELQKVF